MGVDSTLRAAFRNYSTLFLLACVVTVPLYVGLSYAARDVIAVADLHSVIDDWPADRELAGVGAADLQRYRRGLALIAVLQLTAVPLLVRSSRRALDIDRLGGVPTVIGSLKTRSEASGLDYASIRHGVVPIALGIATWLIGLRVGRALGEFFPAEMRWALWGLAGGGAVAGGAPFVLTALAHTSMGRAHKPAKRSSSGRSTGTREETST